MAHFIIIERMIAGLTMISGLSSDRDANPTKDDLKIERFTVILISQGTGLLALCLSLLYNSFVLRHCSKWSAQAQEFEDEIEREDARYELMNKTMRKEEMETVMN